MFNPAWWHNKQQFFTKEEESLLLQAIKLAELSTSGEVRLFVESKCSYVDAIHRAEEIFDQLKMQATAQRNGVLVYVAVKDQQLAIYADSGIYQALGTKYWQERVLHALTLAKQNNLALGLYDVITAVGVALQQHFPYQAGTDKNELPDDIIFGK
ncbi:MAG: TPM domain-containing protein [Bacteroidetes bacterium]|nr:MAG: TPM domain-containing protein [Bacteroidota bacterium]TAE58671.1 MAG: TPM domain-containing protein [Bacteroidota bacterium]TAF91120.1 MAG: TPM domain-containing protein [Bacteroidota bacterium]